MNLHQKGVMRLATAMDEIARCETVGSIRRAPRHRPVVLVIVRLATAGGSTTVVENLFAADLAYLQAFDR